MQQIRTPTVERQGPDGGSSLAQLQQIHTVTELRNGTMFFVRCIFVLLIYLVLDLLGNDSRRTEAHVSLKMDPLGTRAALSQKKPKERARPTSDITDNITTRLKEALTFR